MTKPQLVVLDTTIYFGKNKVPPGNRLEKLQGDRKGQWSVRINGQYRVCFAFRGGNAYHVEIVDYH